jgi:hypothetical protein
MPRFVADVREAAVRCFHLNIALLFPKYGIIYDPNHKLFAVTDIDQFRLWRATNPQSPLHLALFMPNDQLLLLLGEQPARPDPVDTELFMALPPEAPSSSADNGEGA